MVPATLKILLLILLTTGFVLGQAVAKDEVQELVQIRKAAEQGHALAQASLGFRYAEGRGVKQDDEQAVYWYRKAAEQGEVIAQNNLGFMYSKGRGVKQDDEQAVYWYHKAAEQGYALAQASLGFRYAEGRGVKQDDEQAVYWYRKAAEQGEATAQRNLSLMYAQGRGVKQVAHERIAADEKRGFKHITIKDFLLDKKTMPLGSKRAITGFYVVEGRLEALSEAPAIRDYFPHLFLLTDQAPRKVREKLLNCRIGVCRIVVLGHTAECVMTVLGRPTTTDVCLVVNESW